MKKNGISLLRILYVTILALAGTACAPTKNMSPEEFLEKAQSALSNGQPKIAVIQAKNALQRDPKLAPARVILARSYIRLRLGDYAIAELKRLEAANFNQEDLRTDYLDALLISGKYNEIVDETTEWDLPAKFLVISGDARLRLADLQSTEWERKGYLGLARRAYEESIKQDPELQRAYLGLTRIAFRDRDFKAARELIETAEKIDPNHPEVSNLHGILAQLNGNYAQAETHYREANSIAPYDVLYKMNLSRALIIQGKVNEAGEILDDAIREHPTMPALPYLRALAYLQEDDLKAASVVLQTLIKNYPRYAEAQMLLGRVLLSLEQYGQAELAFEAALEIYPNHEQVLAAIELTHRRKENRQGNDDTTNKLVDEQSGLKARAYISSANSAEVEAQRARAKEKWETGQDFLEKLPAEQESILAQKIADKLYDEAFALAFAVNQSWPDLAYPYYWIAQSAIGQGKIDDAKTFLGLALKRDSENIEILLALADLKFRTGEHAEALSLFQKVQTLNAEEPRASLGIARIRMLDQDFAAAEQQINTAEQNNAHPINVLYVKAELAQIQGEHEKQIDFLEKIIEIDKRSIPARLRIARNYFDRQRFVESKSILNDVLSIDRDNRDALILLTENSSTMGELGNAFATALNLVKTYPNDAEALRTLGIVEMRRNRLREAIGHLEDAYALAPDSTSVLQTLAVALHRNKAFTDAALVARKLLNFEPEHSVALRLLGDAALSVKDFAESKKLYKRALDASSGKAAEKIYIFARDLGEIQFARELIEQWGNAHPEGVSAQALLAVDARLHGEHEAAIQRYEAALASNPDNVTLLNDLAWLYSQHNNPKAQSLAARAYSLNPRNPAVADTYGWILLQDGKPEEAVKILEFAATQATRSGDIRFHFAKALAEVGDNARAKLELDAALQLSNLSDRTAAEDFQQQLAAEHE